MIGYQDVLPEHIIGHFVQIVGEARTRTPRSITRNVRTCSSKIPQSQIAVPPNYAPSASCKNFSLFYQHTAFELHQTGVIGRYGTCFTCRFFLPDHGRIILFGPFVLKSKWIT